MLDVKSYLQFRPHGFDLYRLAWRLRRGDDGLGGEVEGNAEDIGVFHIKEAFVRTVLIQFVGLAA